MSHLIKIIFQPASFKKMSKILLPWLWVIFIATAIYALYLALFASPADALHGELVRIMYIHVPSAWLALSIYALVAIFSFISLVWRLPLAYIIAYSTAPIGALFAALALITGSIWGKPAWGTWWVWDARLTSMFILFLFYVCYILIVNAGDNKRRAEKPASIIAILGLINLPIVKFSVEMWNSLHQGASVMKLSGPSIAPEMLTPLLISFAAFSLYTLIMLIIRVRTSLSKEGL